MFSEFGKAIAQWMLSHVGLSIIIFLFILSCLFKLTKREIDPLGAVISWIGRKLTKDLRSDVEGMKSGTDTKISTLKTDLDNFEKKTSKDIDEIKKGTAKNCAELKVRLDQMETAQQKSNDMQTVQTIRAHILDFANSCFNKRKHTKREFENIIDENTLYEELVRKYNIKNNVYKEDYDFIMKIYHQCQEEGSFLKEGD